MLEIQHILNRLPLPLGSSDSVSKHADDNETRPCMRADNRTGTREVDRNLSIR